MFIVDPYGDVRADMRAAVNTANQIAAQAAEQLSGEEFQHLYETLVGYCDKSPDETAVEFNPDALAKITKGAS